MISYIGEIAESIPSVSPHQKSSEVYDIFEKEPLLEGIVVIADNRPVGLVMKTKFYHKLSSKYGFDIYMGRSVDLLMSKSPLIVDYYLPITEASKIAMERNQDDLYDYIIIEKNRQFYGTVNIKNLLIKIAEEQILIARNTNPLTGLPGNTLIKEKLEEALSLQQYSILYADLDNFKAYNDIYGFAKGDDVIRETANIINKYVLLKQKEKSFVGHIGGDDFIAILPNYDYTSICDSIVEEFEKAIIHYYDKKDIDNGYVMVPNRKGSLEETPICSISIAVISNECENYHSVNEISEDASKLKKVCKLNSRSCYITDKSIHGKDCTLC